MAEYSPGKLSMMAAIQFAIDQGCEFFDLLRGDEPYKANWRAAPVACHDLRVWQNQVSWPYGMVLMEWIYPSCSAAKTHSPSTPH